MTDRPGGSGFQRTRERMTLLGKNVQRQWDRLRQRRTPQKMTSDDRWSEESSDDALDWKEPVKGLFGQPVTEHDYNECYQRVSQTLNRVKALLMNMSQELMPLRSISLKKFEQEAGEFKTSKFFTDIFALFQCVDSSVDHIEKEMRVIEKRFRESGGDQTKLRVLISRLKRCEKRSIKDEKALYAIQVNIPNLMRETATSDYKMHFPGHFKTSTEPIRMYDLSKVKKRVKKLRSERKAAEKDYQRRLGTQMTSESNIKVFKERLRRLARKISNIEKSCEKFANGLNEIREESLEYRIDYFLNRTQRTNEVISELLQNCVNIEEQLIDEMKIMGYVSRDSMEFYQREISKVEKIVHKIQSTLLTHINHAIFTFPTLGENVTGIDLYPPRVDEREEQMQQGVPLGEQDYSRIFIPSPPKQAAPTAVSYHPSSPVSSNKSQQQLTSSPITILGLPDNTTYRPPSQTKTFPGTFGDRKVSPSPSRTQSSPDGSHRRF